MELSLLLGRQIISMFLIVVTGYMVVHKGLFTTQDTNSLARVNVMIICPCAIFNSLQREFSAERLAGLGVALAGAIAVHLLWIAMVHLLRKPLHFTGAESASVMYSNGLNLILPLVTATLNDDMVFYVSAFVIVQTAFVWSHGLMLISGQPRIQLKSLFNANFISIFVGLFFYLCHLTLPSILATSVTNIGNMVGPVSMLVIGMLIGPMDLKVVFSNRRAYFITFLRLILFPLAAVLMLRYSGLMLLHPDAEDIFVVTVIAASSCCAALIPQICQVYSDEGTYASILNVMTLFFCIFTLPLIVLIYQLIL